MDSVVINEEDPFAWEGHRGLSSEVHQAPLEDRHRVREMEGHRRDLDLGVRHRVREMEGRRRDLEMGPWEVRRLGPERAP